MYGKWHVIKKLHTFEKFQSSARSRGYVVILRSFFLSFNDSSVRIAIDTKFFVTVLVHFGTFCQDGIWGLSRFGYMHLIS